MAVKNSGTAFIPARQRVIRILGALAAALTLCLFVLAVSATAATVSEPVTEVTGARIQRLMADDHRISFSVETPAPSILSGGKLKVPGLDQRLERPGLPAVPFFSTYIVLPPESVPRLTIERAQPVIQMVGSLTAAPLETVRQPPVLGAPFPPLTPADASVDPPFDHEATDALRSAPTGKAESEYPTGLFPQAIAEISEPMMVRDVRLARVSVYPIQVDPGQRLLSVTPKIEVVIDFERQGPPLSPRLAPSVGDRHLASIADVVLNPEQLAGFRSLPASADEARAALPSGAQLFKIAVTADGVHQLTYRALKDAGMDVDDVDPRTLAMMYRGRSIATSFSGDADATFEVGEALRFYGQVFDGSRLERQFISENVYWLWAGEQARPMPSVASVTGQPVTSYLATLTREPERIYFQGFTANWPENEPDAWYWDWWAITGAPLTRSHTMTLPYPAPSGPPARFTAEFSSRDSHIADQAHSLAMTMNGYPSAAERSWWGELNFNISATVAHTAVLTGLNSFETIAETEGKNAYVALNRITVDYQRELRADADQLIFTDQSDGARWYQVRGFSRPEKDRYLAWDVTDPYSPTAILTSTLEIAGSGPYTVAFGRERSGEARYILTSLDNLISPDSISPYSASQLDPPAGAQWLAIAHRNFVTETLRLAGHRAQPAFGGLSTHVVDIEDITNQYGYGLPVPGAIQDYLAHAVSTWPVKPTYVVLVGDTTLDPRRIKDEWTDQQYVPTDLPFVDAYNGQIPSDLIFALVSGEDLLPDLSVGRLAVESVAELELVVDKIIRYDENQRLSFGWMQTMLFVSDEYDPSAGDFCQQNAALAGRLPPGLGSQLLCLDDYDGGGTPDAEALREDMTAWLENSGATMLTYRGHGAINNWGGDPVIFNLAYASELQNLQPFVAVSGDCLDGHYAYPPYEGLGERLVNFWAPSVAPYGAAAHWGSSGLGISPDHTDMLNGFYDGLFSAGLTTLGDAVNYAKLAYYLDSGNDPALMYSFNLQGDPAMHLLRPGIELQGHWQQDTLKAGEQATLTLMVQNHGVYPAPVSLVGDRISDFTVAAVSSTVAHSVTTSGDSTRITLQFGQDASESGIPRGGQVIVTVTYQVAAGAAPGQRVARFESEAAGLEIWPGDEQIAEPIAVLKESIWLPALRG